MMKLMQPFFFAVKHLGTTDVVGNGARMYLLPNYLNGNGKS